MAEFDFIIVGGGTAGCVLADRLTECSHRVLLLETGGDPPEEALVPSLFPFLPHSQYDYNFTSENDNFTYQSLKLRAASLTSGRLLGGSGSVNYMVYVRGCPGDYNTWAQDIGDKHWDWKHVLPYFIKSEKMTSDKILKSSHKAYHGTKGFIKVTREDRPEINKYMDSFKEVGKQVVIDTNGPTSTGYTPLLSNIADGIRQTTAYTNLAKIKGRPNLVVRKNSFVTKVIIDDNNVAKGVEYVTEGKTFRAMVRREVVISAGAINTPRLLLSSGIGPRQHLEEKGIKVKKDLPVGQNLQDHVTIMLSIKLEESKASTPPPDPRKMPFPIFTGFIALNESQSCPDYQVMNLLAPHDNPGPMQLCSFNFGYEDNICKNLNEAGKGRNMLLANLILLHPRSRGKVTLKSSDPMDQPIVELGTFTNKQDLDDAARYVEDFVQVVNSSYFKSINAEVANLPYPKCGPMRPGLEFWRCYVLNMMTTLWHYSGTSSMGPVLDAELRVHGVRGLRVADASVMPRVVGGNTFAPVVMVAEKAADYIKKEHTCGEEKTPQ